MKNDKIYIVDQYEYLAEGSYQLIDTKYGCLAGKVHWYLPE